VLRVWITNSEKRDRRPGLNISRCITRYPRHERSSNLPAQVAWAKEFIMAKSQDAKKGSKKPALKSAKEKKADKAAKKVANKDG
jgi:hypothetical protein